MKKGIRSILFRGKMYGSTSSSGAMGYAKLAEARSIIAQRSSSNNGNNKVPSVSSSSTTTVSSSATVLPSSRTVNNTITNPYSNSSGSSSSSTTMIPSRSSDTYPSHGVVPNYQHPGIVSSATIKDNLSVKYGLSGNNYSSHSTSTNYSSSSNPINPYGKYPSHTSQGLGTMSSTPASKPTVVPTYMVTKSTTTTIPSSSSSSSSNNNGNYYTNNNYDHSVGYGNSSNTNGNGELVSSSSFLRAPVSPTTVPPGATHSSKLEGMIPNSSSASSSYPYPSSSVYPSNYQPSNYTSSLPSSYASSQNPNSYGTDRTNDHRYHSPLVTPSRTSIPNPTTLKTSTGSTTNNTVSSVSQPTNTLRPPLSPIATTNSSTANPALKPHTLPTTGNPTPSTRYRSSSSEDESVSYIPPPPSSSFTSSTKHPLHKVPQASTLPTSFTTDDTNDIPYWREPALPLTQRTTAPASTLLNQVHSKGSALSSSSSVPSNGTIPKPSTTMTSIDRLSAPKRSSMSTSTNVPSMVNDNGTSTSSSVSTKTMTKATSKTNILASSAAQGTPTTPTNNNPPSAIPSVSQRTSSTVAKPSSTATTNTTLLKRNMSTSSTNSTATKTNEGENLSSKEKKNSTATALPTKSSAASLVSRTALSDDTATTHATLPTQGFTKTASKASLTTSTKPSTVTRTLNSTSSHASLIPSSKKTIIIQEDDVSDISSVVNDIDDDQDDENNDPQPYSSLYPNPTNGSSKASLPSHATSTNTLSTPRKVPSTHALTTSTLLPSPSSVPSHTSSPYHQYGSPSSSSVSVSQAPSSQPQQTSPISSRSLPRKASLTVHTSASSVSSATLTTSIATTTQNKNQSTNGPAVPISEAHGLVGFQNLGNTCFMNSTLQCLSNIPELVEYFTSSLWTNDLNKRGPSKGEMAAAYAELMTKVWRYSRGTGNIERPSRVKTVIGNVASRFLGYDQHDAQEFLRTVLDALHDDVNKITGKLPYKELEDLPTESDVQMANTWWKYYLSRNNSQIWDLFAGQLRTEVTCLVCNNRSRAFDPVLDLSIPIPKTAQIREKTSGSSILNMKSYLSSSSSSSSFGSPESAYSSSSYDDYSSTVSSPGFRNGTGACNIYHCLDSYVAPEKLDDDNSCYCSKCKKHQPSIKRSNLYRLPSVLVLHLKRFSFGNLRRSKITTNVDFPVNNLNLAPYLADGSPEHRTNVIYDCVGVINHMGGLGGGHYTADCYNKDTKQWFNFNDSRVSSTSPTQLSGTSAYVLFYIRR